MNRHSHVSRRMEHRIDRAFPASPTLPATGRYHGLAVPRRLDAALTGLRPLRDRIDGLWHGRLVSNGHTTDLVLAVFDRPIVLDEATGGLPLAATGSYTLCSFVQQAEGPASVPVSGEFRRVELWWGGRAHRLAIETLTKLSIAALWHLPELRIHLPHRPVPVSSVAADGAGVTPPDLPTATTPAKITRAALPPEIERKGVLEAMTAAMSAPPQPGPGRPPSLLARLFRGLLAGGEGAAGGAAAQHPSPPRPPGVWDSLTGWLRWHTPLGDDMKRRFANRLDQVEDLIKRGEIDEVLRLALKLGADGAPEGSGRLTYPNRPPDRRASLDFDVVSQDFSVPILGGNTFQSLRTRYQNLAEQLERSGDYRRAAYIRSQLLCDHRGAVLELEKGEMYREAAKLALDARLEPVLIVRLFYRAGDLDTALALAKRHACFDQLAETSRETDRAFHAYVVAAWTDQLLGTGQPLRAVQVTDQLARLPDADAALLRARRQWIATALADAGSDGFGFELAARALLTATWTADDLSPAGLEAFPLMPAIRGTGRYPALLEWIQAVVRGEADDSREAMLGLLAGIGRIAAAGGAEQTAFWDGPAQPLIESFSRALIARAADGLAQADIRILHDLLSRAGLPVLAADLGKLRKLQGAKPVAHLLWMVPPPDALQSAVRVACAIASGKLLLWRDNGMLELTDRLGAPLWWQQVDGVVALIPVARSPNVLVVQAQPDGTHLLSRIATHRREVHAIGAVRGLTAWHDVTAEGHWLVQIGGDIGALDLARLCAPAPEIHFLWSCRLTERLRVLAFAHLHGRHSWITRDVGPDRNGVLEFWTLYANGHLTTALCFPPSLAATASHDGRAENAVERDRQWRWDPARIAAPHDPTLQMRVALWTEGGDREARALFAERDDRDVFQPCDLQRAAVHRVHREAGPACLAVSTTVAPPITITLDPGERGGNLFWLARSEANTGTVLIADELGRLFVADLERRRVTAI